MTVEAVCHSAAEAMQTITNHPVQLVFLDIEMPHMNGFQLMEKLPHINFDLIFTTSYDQYALKVIKFSALDYLLKPIDRIELQAAVRKATTASCVPASTTADTITKLHQPAQQVNQVALPTMEGLQLVPLDSIISCSSSSNYTIISLKDKLKITVSRTLKEVEEMLEESGFMRVHHSYLVNLNEIRKYIKGEGGNLIMSDGSSIDVSRSKKELLLKKLQPGKNQFTTR